MRLPIIFLCLLAVMGMAVTQPSRTEVTNPATPEDLKPNSDNVPEAYAIDGQFERIMVLRFKHQTDLLAGLESMVKKHNIRNAVILSALGSVRSYHFHTVGNGTFPVKNIYVKNPDGPADIVSISGYVVDGRVHAHITMTEADKAFGGHLEPGTSVFTFAVVTVGIFKDGIDLSRVDDLTYR